MTTTDGDYYVNGQQDNYTVMLPIQDNGNTRALGQIDVIQDPFLVQDTDFNTVDMSQWDGDWGALSLAGGDVFTIDDFVFSPTYYDNPAAASSLSNYGQNRVANGPAIQTAGLVQTNGFLRDAANRPDFQWDVPSGGPYNDLRLDATPGRMLFYTETVSVSGVIQTRLHWLKVGTAAGSGTVDPDLAVRLGAGAGKGVTTLKAVENGANYRLFVRFDSGATYAVDVGATGAITATKALSWSGTPNTSMRTGRAPSDPAGTLYWYTGASDEAGKLMVYREDLYNGGGKQLYKQVSTPNGDGGVGSEDVLTDNQGNVFLLTRTGLYEIGAGGFQGYVLLGLTFYAENVHGNGPTRADNFAEVDVSDFDAFWFSK